MDRLVTILIFVNPKFSITLVFNVTWVKKKNHLNRITCHLFQIFFLWNILILSIMKQIIYILFLKIVTSGEYTLLLMLKKKWKNRPFLKIFLSTESRLGASFRCFWDKVMWDAVLPILRTRNVIYKCIIYIIRNFVINLYFCECNQLVSVFNRKQNVRIFFNEEDKFLTCTSFNFPTLHLHQFFKNIL